MEVDIAGLASKSSFSFIARLSSASTMDIGSGIVSGLTFFRERSSQVAYKQTLKKHKFLILLGRAR
jgi:hypothetical protein